MYRTGILALGAISLTAACHRPASVPTNAVPRAHFAIVLERSNAGWSAHCDDGCRWTDLTMSCSGCQVRLTAIGIGPANLPEEGPDGFAFTLKEAGTGWEAVAIRGVRWRSLTWGCGAPVCRARIDEAGVSGS